MPAGAGLDLTSLCITTSKACWHIYVDALVVSTDGNVADAISIAALVSLLSGRRVGAFAAVVCYRRSLSCLQPSGLLSTVLLAASMHQGILGAVMAALAQGRLIPEAALATST